MDDEQFEDYVGTEEVIEQKNKQQDGGEKLEQTAKEIAVEIIGVMKDDNIDEVGHNQESNTLHMMNQDNIIRIDNKEQELGTHDQSITANQQPQKVHPQHHQPYRPQQIQYIKNQEQPINSNPQPIDTYQPALAQNDHHLQEQTVFQNIQQKLVEKSVGLSQMNQVKKQESQVHDSMIINEGALNNDQGLNINEHYTIDGTLIDENNLISEPIYQPTNHLDHNTLDYQVNKIDMNQAFPPIQISNQPYQQQKTQSSPDLNIYMMNLEPLHNITQTQSIYSYQQSTHQLTSTNYGSSPLQQQTHFDPSNFEQKLVQNYEILINEQIYKQNDLPDKSHQQTNEIENYQTNQNDRPQEQDDEFGDFETYQQSNNQIPIPQTIPQEMLSEQITIQFQSQSNHQHIDPENQVTDQISLSQQIQLSTKQDISEPKQVQYTQIHPQVSKQPQNSQPNQEFQPVEPQKMQTISSQIQQTIPKKQLTLQDQIEAFINSLPNYKRICQRVFYNPG